MRITPVQLPNRFLIVPNRDHFFGEVCNQENPLDVIETFSYRDIAKISLIRLGAIGFRFFDNGPLQSIMRLKTSGSGLVPEYVTQNHDEVVELQSRRIVFANFIAGAMFGRIAALRHTALSGAQYAGMDEILSFTCQGEQAIIENSRHTNLLISPKVRFIRETPDCIQVISHEQIGDAVQFLTRIAQREGELEYADIQACMVMNYQAAILHNEQHSAASLALNFAVTEALIHEIFFAYGIVGERRPRPFATREHSVPDISNNQFKQLRLGNRLTMLLNGGLIDEHLHQRLDEARSQRNTLMHSAAGVSTTQAGNMQTSVRDLWSYVLNEPFELASNWSMRI